jgi:low temperature requirement protein LtrA
MASESNRRRRVPRINPEMRERESVLPLELFFDLVFVLGFTQCTALMVAEPTFEGVGRGMLALAVLWWAWVGYAWLTSVINPEEGAVRIAFFGAMAALLIVALCVPEAFGDRALTFAIAYAIVRAGQIVLFLLGSRDDAQLHHSIVGLAISSAMGAGLLVGASFLDGWAQAALWGLAIVIDWGGPALFGVRGWQLVPGHFAERHGLIIILALGEAIIALGVGAEVDLTFRVIVAAVLGIGLSAALWWTYFDVVALVTALRLIRATDRTSRNRLARDSYSYLHFPMVAGIVLTALGEEAVLAHVDDPLDGVHAFALLGGVSCYLLAHVALRLRNAHTLNRQRLALALLLLALIPVAMEVSALVTVIGINVLIWGMIGFETSRYGENRYQLRHGGEVEVAGVPPHDDDDDAETDDEGGDA